MKPNHYVHGGSHLSCTQTKKRRKKVATGAHEEEGPPTGKPTGPLPQVASQSKPVSKKGKAKGKKKDEKDEGDDLDKALAELSVKCVVSVLVFLSIVSCVTFKVSRPSTNYTEWLCRHTDNETFCPFLSFCLSPRRRI